MYSSFAETFPGSVFRLYRDHLAELHYGQNAVAFVSAVGVIEDAFHDPLDLFVSHNRFEVIVRSVDQWLIKMPRLSITPNGIYSASTDADLFLAGAQSLQLFPTGLLPISSS